MTVPAIDTCCDVRAFFQERLLEAFESQRTTASPGTEAYLLDLLTTNCGTSSLDSLESPLVDLLASAQAAVGTERMHRFRALGDTALMVYGFFSELIAKRGVSDSYVCAMGGTGYSVASGLIGGRGRDRVSAHIFRELSERFGEIGAVVADVRDQTSLGEREVVMVYDRWVRTRSPRLARRLARAGLFPENPGAPRES